MNVSRFVAAVAVAVAVVGAGPASAAAAVPQTYRIVGTGDSILHRAIDQLEASDRWWDLEPGRQIDARGAANRASYTEIWPEVLARSQKAGYVVFEDDGTLVTDERWAEFMDYLVASTPDDRCLVGVLPYMATTDSNRAPRPDVANRRLIMFRAWQKQPCNLLIPWDQVAARQPELLEDRQHPNAAGRRLLADIFDRYLGVRPSGGAS